MRLKEVIQDINKKRKPQNPYANMMTIIQSSGTGKSRMVDQLARVVFTLPFNIRDPQDTIRKYWTTPLAPAAAVDRSVVRGCIP